MLLIMSRDKIAWVKLTCSGGTVSSFNLEISYSKGIQALLCHLSLQNKLRVTKKSSSSKRENISLIRFYKGSAAVHILLRHRKSRYFSDPKEKLTNPSSNYRKPTQIRSSTFTRPTSKSQALKYQRVNWPNTQQKSKNSSKSKKSSWTTSKILNSIFTRSRR